MSTSFACPLVAGAPQTGQTHHGEDSLLITVPSPSWRPFNRPLNTSSSWSRKWSERRYFQQSLGKGANGKTSPLHHAPGERQEPGSNATASFVSSRSQPHQGAQSPRFWRPLALREFNLSVRPHAHPLDTVATPRTRVCRLVEMALTQSSSRRWLRGSQQPSPFDPRLHRKVGPKKRARLCARSILVRALGGYRHLNQGASVRFSAMMPSEGQRASGDSPLLIPSAVKKVPCQSSAPSECGPP